MALGTVVRDVYTNAERHTMYRTLGELLGPPNWSTAGLYCYWDPATHEALYIGLAKDLQARFAQHNSLNGNKPNKGNKGEKINDWFQSHDRLGFSLVIQSALADDANERYSAIGEGQLIEGYRSLHGVRPPWNKIGGSKDGAGWARSDTAAWFDFMTGKVDGLLVSRRTIRELNDDITAEFNEAAIHMSRTGMNFHAVDGKLDDSTILAGLKTHMVMTTQLHPYLAREYNFDALRDYLKQPAPHPEDAKYTLDVDASPGSE
ncbi:hypothetical protein ACFYSW_25135 [Rhodococcus aetherivorans]|uniref:hypothetical protein n=1 Tax=Rhodococcus aetherivorans TaxID=191292 RepID=UPI0036B3850C